MAGQDNWYGGVLLKGFLTCLFVFNTLDEHPYGSLSNGMAAFCNSPVDDLWKSNPVEAGGS